MDDDEERRKVLAQREAAAEHPLATAAKMDEISERLERATKESEQEMAAREQGARTGTGTCKEVQNDGVGRQQGKCQTSRRHRF